MPKLRLTYELHGETIVTDISNSKPIFQELILKEKIVHISNNGSIAYCETVQIRTFGTISLWPEGHSWIRYRDLQKDSRFVSCPLCRQAAKLEPEPH